MWWIAAYLLMLVSLIGAMAWIVVHSPVSSLYKTLAVLVLVLSVPAGAAAFIGALGHPLPTYPPVLVLEGRHNILGFKMVPFEGIYVLLDSEGNQPPQYRKLPWNKEEANKLQRAGAEGVEAQVAVLQGDDQKMFDFDFEILGIEEVDGIPKEIPAQPVIIPNSYDDYGELEGWSLLAQATPAESVPILPHAEGYPQGCHKHTDLVVHLRENFGEVTKGVALVDGGQQTVELFVSTAKSWSFALNDTKGVSCVFATGTNWEYDIRTPKQIMDFLLAPPA
jgi:hypothetical protein